MSFDRLIEKIKETGNPSVVGLDPKLEYVQDLVESYGYSLLNTEQYEAALGLEGVYNEFSISCEFPHPQPLFSGTSVTRLSVVNIIAAIDAAFCNADLVTFVGSIMPDSTISTTSLR